MPGYLEAQKDLKALGIDEVIIYCVNDGAVMDAWAEDQGVDQKGGFLTMMGDPSGSLTRALGMALNHPGPMKVLGYERCKRFALYIDDGTIKIVRVAEVGPTGEEDPAGDDCMRATDSIIPAAPVTTPRAHARSLSPARRPRGHTCPRDDRGHHRPQEEGRALGTMPPPLLGRRAQRTRSEKRHRVGEAERQCDEIDMTLPARNPCHHMERGRAEPFTFLVAFAAVAPPRARAPRRRRGDTISRLITP